MDALALLCNLYGDGPATLKRLRAAGLDSFPALEDLEPDQLALVLGTHEAAARRFLREARLLFERLEEGEVEGEERAPLAEPAPALPAPVPEGEPEGAAGRQARTQGPREGGRAPRGRDPARAPRDLEAGGDGSTALIDRVLATWRERDSSAGAERDVEFSGSKSEARAQHGALAETGHGTPLRPRLVDGLDRTICDRLHETGFVTLEKLADTDALVIARSSGTELTRVLRLQFLARRLMSERGQVESPEPPDVLRPAGRPAAPVQTLRPAPALPRPRDEARSAKFSISETPFGAGARGLSDDLERASGDGDRAGGHASPERGDEDAGGPFA
jgi:hypothetical protein